MVLGVPGRHAKPSAWRSSPTRTLGVAFGAWIAIAVYLLLLPGGSGFEMAGPGESEGRDPGLVREDRTQSPREPIRSTPAADRPSASPSATTSPSAPSPSVAPTGRPSSTPGKPSSGAGATEQSAPSEPAPSDEPPGKANGHDRDRGPKNKP